MGLEGFIIGGHSFGAYMTAFYAIKYPKHLKRVLLLSPFGMVGH